MTIKMLIDATNEEETRVAIVHGNRVEEFDYESSAKKQIKGNIYLAKITRVEPSLQAAFVEYGGNRHGFLAFSEIHPDYYQIPVSDREALIAEEAAAYAKLLDEEEEVPEKKPKRRSRRKPKDKSVDESENGETAPETSEDGTKPDSEAETKDDASVADSDVSSPEVTADPAIDVSADNAPAETPEVIEEPAPEAESAPKADAEPEKDSDEKSVTKAEFVTEPETMTGDVTPDDLDEDATDADTSDDDEDADEDETETTGSHAFDDEEAEEKLRIKIAKGLRRRYKIQEVIKKNQVVLIQVVKEERGNKGAALTTYLSLPGRYCVLMPNTLHGGGVSRKIANVSERKSLKKILSDLDMPSGIACIIRTAGQSRTKTEIKRDFDYLIRTWEGIRERTLKSVAPIMINEEGDLIKRSIRDLYTREIDEILVEGEEGYKTARTFMRLLMPSHARKIKHYTEQIPLFHRFQVESQLDSMFSPTVQLKSGGYIVINPTEALVSIDVNSGKATKEHNIEETARKTNLEAAEEVARQLRLRDMAGLVVIDFIDMEVRANNRAVEQKLKECLKSDRARIQVGKISSFGLLEMSRQRLRAGILESSTRSCPHCEGSGLIRSVETQVLHILRALEEEGIRGRNNKVTLYLPEQAAIYMLNNKRAKLVNLEDQYKFTIEVAIDTSLTEASYRLDAPNSDDKKSDRPSGTKQGKGRESSQRNDRSQSRPDRDRTTSSRRNRQRNQSRKNRTQDQGHDQNPEQNPDQNQDRGQEQNQQQDIKEPQVTQEAPENTQENPTPDTQESKPRRRRRRSRRGPRSRTDENAPQNAEETSDAASEVKTETPVASQGDSTEKTTVASSEAPQKMDAAPAEKADKKTSRRPYPPQTRSRRKASDNKKSDAAKSDSSDSKQTRSEPAVKTETNAPKKERKSEAAKPSKPKTTEPKSTPPKEAEPKKAGPKKSGWWQRTFG